MLFNGPWTWEKYEDLKKIMLKMMIDDVINRDKIIKDERP